MNDHFTASRFSTPNGASFDRLRMSGQHLLMVVYDSVTNSVFESQVFTPLVGMVERGEVAHVTLVTFESDVHIMHKLSAFSHSAIKFIVLKRYPLMGIWGLRLSAWQLRTAFPPLTGRRSGLVSCISTGSGGAEEEPSVDRIRARGPLAGLIAKYALELGVQSPAHGELVEPRPDRGGRAGNVIQLTIQARGLCAEEYRFTSEQRKLSWWQKIVVSWRKNLYDRIEQKAYAQSAGVTIEVVSDALGEYLQKTYATPASMITMAQHDLVEMLPANFIATQRQEMRALLGIPVDAYVFCYSGSSKPWQCAEETVRFFAREAKTNPQAFFLILSQDAAAFQALLAEHYIPVERMRLLGVKPAELLRYLCAADAGMLLRKPDVVNWVSRPTKLLEYQAAGLRVVHNGTIGMLANKA
jgi:hypothetical protein